MPYGITGLEKVKSLSELWCYTYVRVHSLRQKRDIPLHFHRALHQSSYNMSSHIKIICQVIRTDVPNVPASVKMAGWN